MQTSTSVSIRLLLWVCCVAFALSAPVLLAPSNAHAAKKAKGNKAPARPNKGKSDCTQACEQDGKCRAKRGKCYAKRGSDCAKSTGCVDEGRCTLKGGACVVGSNADCLQSSACRCHTICCRLYPARVTWSGARGVEAAPPPARCAFLNGSSKPPHGHTRQSA